MDDQTYVIAIDGPAASGKGTLARALAQEMNLFYLDTGLLYRAFARQAIEHGVSADESNRTKLSMIDVHLHDLDNSDLRSRNINNSVSHYAENP